MRCLLFPIAFAVLSSLALAQSSSEPNQAPPSSSRRAQKESQSQNQAPPRSDSANQQSADQQSGEEKTPGDEVNAPPKSSGESSSRENIGDLAPPKGDEKHAGVEDSMEDADSEVSNFKPWNPHKAMKDVEVGDYYAKQKNYRAAISRYREALEYKPKDAEATFKLAQTLEKVNAYQEARDDYEAYLIILPHGSYADKARQGIDRLKDKSHSRPRLSQNGLPVTATPSTQSSQNPR
jgi:tetratricopeptide (TPR) repeat protein